MLEIITYVWCITIIQVSGRELFTQKRLSLFPRLDFIDKMLPIKLFQKLYALREVHRDLVMPLTFSIIFVTSREILIKILAKWFIKFSYIDQSYGDALPNILNNFSIGHNFSYYLKFLLCHSISSII